MDETNQQNQVNEQPVNPPITEEKPEGLMPGQEHEDELNVIGDALFGVFGKMIDAVKHLFTR